MRLSHLRHGLLAVLLFALIGCNTTPETTVESTAERSSQTQVEADESGSSTVAKQSETTQTETKRSAVDTKDKPKPIAAALMPGQYCYQSNDENQDLYARLTIDSADSVTGNFVGTVHNEAAGYYTSYRQTLNGTIDGSNLNMDVATWIEYDKQNSQETWKVTSKGLSTERETLSLSSCEAVSKEFGLDAEDLTAGANSVRERDVFFDAGKSATTVSDSVVRGDRDLYKLTAQGGQKMNLSISSVEDNAAFDVISPSGSILGREMKEEEIYLPERGEYKVVVGGTRGNATYELDIAID